MPSDWKTLLLEGGVCLRGVYRPNSRTAADTTMRLLSVMEPSGREGRGDRWNLHLRPQVPCDGGGDADRL